jgi:hypothetical protein
MRSHKTAHRDRLPHETILDAEPDQLDTLDEDELATAAHPREPRDVDGDADRGETFVEALAEQAVELGPELEREVDPDASQRDEAETDAARIGPPRARRKRHRHRRHR